MITSIIPKMLSKKAMILSIIPEEDHLEAYDCLCTRPKMSPGMLKIIPKNGEISESTTLTIPSVTLVVPELLL